MKNVKTAIYPGSFDPMTKGHLDVLERASSMFEKVIIAVLNNTEKKCLLSTKERVELIKKSVKRLGNVRVDSFDGLTIEYARQQGATVLIRGLRAVSDFEYEMQMSQMNSSLAPEINTIFLITKPEYNFISSSTIKEIVMMGGDISQFVPKEVKNYLENKYKKGK